MKSSRLSLAVAPHQHFRTPSLITNSELHHQFSQYRDSRSKYLGLNLCKSVFIRTQSPIQSNQFIISLQISLEQSNRIKRTQFPTRSLSLIPTQFLILGLSLSVQLNFSLKQTQSLSQIVSPISLS